MLYSKVFEHCKHHIFVLKLQTLAVRLPVHTVCNEKHVGVHTGKFQQTQVHRIIEQEKATPRIPHTITQCLL